MDTKPMANQGAKVRQKARLRFNYIKGPSYREVVCHGAIGGATPSGDGIWMALYVERGAIPRVVEYEVEGAPGEPIQFSEQNAEPVATEERAGIIRHIDVTTYMGLDVAKKIHKWLGDNIETLEKRKSEEK